MKKLLIATIFILGSFLGYSQVIPKQADGSVGKMQWNPRGHGGGSFLFNGVDTIHSEAVNVGMIVRKSSNGHYYEANGVYWQIKDKSLVWGDGLTVNQGDLEDTISAEGTSGGVTTFTGVDSIAAPFDGGMSLYASGVPITYFTEENVTPTEDVDSVRIVGRNACVWFNGATTCYTIKTSFSTPTGWQKNGDAVIPGEWIGSTSLNPFIIASSNANEIVKFRASSGSFVASMLPTIFYSQPTIRPFANTGLIIEGSGLITGTTAYMSFRDGPGNLVPGITNGNSMFEFKANYSNNSTGAHENNLIDINAPMTVNNVSQSNTFNIINYGRTITNSAGTSKQRFIYYHPTLVGTNTVHFIHNLVGDTYFGTVSGNTVIGDSIPTSGYKFEVNGKTYLRDHLFVGTSDASGWSAVFGPTAGGASGIYSNGGDIKMGAGAQTSLQFQTDGMRMGSGASGDLSIRSNASTNVMSFYTNNTLALTLKASQIINIANTPVYADNAAALTGGLVAGDVYRTGDNLKIVH